MTKKVDQWMPLYVAEFIADTTMLTAEQVGAYMLLMMAAWRHAGELPDNDAQLAVAARLSASAWRRARPVLQKFFVQRDGMWVQKRLSAEYARAQEVSQSRGKSGAKGAAARWQNGNKADGDCHGVGMANAMANGMANAMANGMANPSQIDGQIQIQEQEIPTTEARHTPNASEREQAVCEEAPAAMVGQFEGNIDPPPHPVTATPAVIAAVALRKLGYGDIHGHHPALCDALSEGLAFDHLMAVAERYAGSGKPGGYVISAARREHAEFGTTKPGEPNAAGAHRRESSAERIERINAEHDAREAAGEYGHVN